MVRASHCVVHVLHGTGAALSPLPCEAVQVSGKLFGARSCFVVHDFPVSRLGFVRKKAANEK